MFWLDLNTLNFLFSVGGLFLSVVVPFLFLDYFFNRSRFYKRWVSFYVWPLIVFSTVGGVIISLVYSEYFGFIPCSLCWLQRIALYPQALFSLMAVKTKEQVFFPLYSIALSVFGLGVALYHYIYQMLPAKESTGMIMPCLADGSADCAVKIINEFGFITFPYLSGVIFAFLIILYLNLIRESK